ncbi:glycosyltransferase involved in cell wall biosynthesis [Tamilnaduibacter salinus]|uniref:Glycosyltransferase involved in cell wall biosynthesis n=1 Tax=Tamilnaduibacter salinus TaxID=1484056 RepID=A0A2U1CU30_9GAMM|nr:glycosyltransferase [Tamilnaduibacter salinus]PVY70349.1 glycosyltransferase involved in cell wall biosynthesis [Tamilnaduibacter salinus]
MRVVLVLGTPGTTWGGMETHTRDLAQGLAQRGVDVHVLAHPAYEWAFHAGATFHSLPLDQGRRHPWLRHCLRRDVTALKPDVVHAQGHKAAALLSALSRQPHTPVRLGTVHGEKRTNRAFDGLDGVIVVNQRLASRISNPKVRVIRNGAVPVDRPTSRPESCPAGQPLLLASGRLEPVKQFDRLIRAWAAIGTPGQLVILGDGRERHALQDQIDTLGIGDNTHLVGHRADASAWPWLADLFVLPSAREGLPYSVIEALLAGCPVVSTPVGDIPDFLPQTCIADNTDLASITHLLADTMVRLPSLAGEQSDVFLRAQTELSITAMVDATVRFYQQCLEPVRND